MRYIPRRRSGDGARSHLMMQRRERDGRWLRGSPLSVGRTAIARGGVGLLGAAAVGAVGGGGGAHGYFCSGLPPGEKLRS
jgi:hypothetical protein